MKRKRVHRDAADSPTRSNPRRRLEEYASLGNSQVGLATREPTEWEVIPRWNKKIEW